MPVKPMTITVSVKDALLERSDMREVLADVSHEIWAHWMGYLFSKCENTQHGLNIPWDLAVHWKLQVDTPYAELTESEKDSDREQADRIIAVMFKDGY